MSGRPSDGMEHRITRKIETESVQELRVDRLGNIDEDILTRAISAKGEWECDCGTGPFETEEEAKKHLRDRSADTDTDDPESGDTQ